MHASCRVMSLLAYKRKKARKTKSVTLKLRKGKSRFNFANPQDSFNFDYL